MPDTTPNSKGPAPIQVTDDGTTVRTPISLDIRPPIRMDVENVSSRPQNNRSGPSTHRVQSPGSPVGAA
ncbi:hypothetical protein [Streptomyces sp. NPDC056683]|uniref:hypothetical protein n=1 Tax=Streptomyces sp. NPDC056683 TaxID=3345910 RepID=UPI0036B8946C